MKIIGLVSNIERVEIYTAHFSTGIIGGVADQSTATVSGHVASCDGPQLAQARSDRLILPRAY